MVCLFVFKFVHSKILPNFGPDRKYRQKQPKTTQRRTKNERVLGIVFHYFYETNITKFIKSKPKL